jgi:hypothetical protein
MVDIVNIMEESLSRICVSDDVKNLHIYPTVLMEIDCEENAKNSLVINYIFDKIDSLLKTVETIHFHVHTNKMKIRDTPKYKKLVSLFIQIISVKYETILVDKCYLYDVNRAMKVLLDLVKPVLPQLVKSSMVIVKEVNDDNDD